MIRVILLLIFIAPLAGAGFVYHSLTEPNKGKGGMIVDIERGQSARSVAHMLENSGVINNATIFEIGARLQGTTIKAGEYKFAKNLAVVDVLAILTEGKAILRKVTIPEGLTIIEIGQRLQSSKIVGAKKFYDTCQQLASSGKWKIAADSLEGYLFPETYSFPKGVTAKSVVVAMVEQLFKNINGRIPADLLNDPARLHRLITLASIIEKETGAGHERKLISAIFHSRLKKKMLLQSDPTVIYGLPNFDGNIRKKDLSYDSRYNTYVYSGLPPGPIANPGLDSIIAAHNPAEANFLYFVSKNNGEHYFSRTLKEHNRAVRIYQIEKRGRK